ncbi:MAG TPA: hypothetical protein PLS11_13755, partial [Ottowia sp.]|nr:hypothetical protein [Ottowia sp.]
RPLGRRRADPRHGGPPDGGRRHRGARRRGGDHPAVPNGYDPPLHTAYRRALDGFFAPERMQRFEPVCRDNAASMVQQALGLRSSWAAKPWRRASACRSTGSPPTAIRAL